MLETCPLCEEGQLSEIAEQDKETYKGIRGLVVFHYSVCNYCESEQANSAQTKINKENMVNFRLDVDESLKSNDSYFESKIKK
jgi:HTH-type transcriptional regulator/antitoxin MqsA